MIVLIIIILFIYFASNTEFFSNHGREIIQALDHDYNDNVNCDFHQATEYDIIHTPSDFESEQLGLCNTYGKYKMVGYHS